MTGTGGLRADPTSDAAHDLAFRARALAQAHALSEPAAAYRRWRVGRDAATHPVPELTTWAQTAFLTGYCVRRVEESQQTADPLPTSAAPGHSRAPEEWERAAAQFANTLPTDPATTLADHSVVSGALDDVISREVDKRAEHVREHLTEADWQQFQAFVGWWVLHGYAVRATESP